MFESIAEVLEIPVERVKLDSGLLTELGAESLDLLDLAFRIEARFNVSLPRTDVMEHAQSESLFGLDGLAHGGRLTALGLRVLAAMRPELAPADLVPGLTVAEARRLLTPRTFVRLIETLSATNEQFARTTTSCPTCGGSSLAPSAVAPELVCAECDACVAFPSGDETLVRELVRLRDALRAEPDPAPTE